MPHLNIKHFPANLNHDQQKELIESLTRAIQNTFNCEAGVISISLEPIAKEAWNEEVYVPEILNRASLLHKSPNY